MLPLTISTISLSPISLNSINSISFAIIGILGIFTLKGSQLSEEKKDKTGEENSNAAEVIKELGLLTTGSGFKSEIQHIK